MTTVIRPTAKETMINKAECLHELAISMARDIKRLNDAGAHYMATDTAREYIAAIERLINDPGDND